MDKTATTAAEEAISRCPSYYSDMEEDFQDFDDPLAFHMLLKRAANSRANNFVLDFGEKHARCGFDVTPNDMASLLSKERPAECDTRWINIWGPHRQRDIIDLLARKYGFSPRLTGLMRAAPHKNRPPMSRASSKRSAHHKPPSRWSLKQSAPTSNGLQTSPDMEKGPSLTTVGGESEQEILSTLNHYDVVSTIYHWSSVDLGVNYFCLGFNLLHKVNETLSRPNDAESNAQSRAERRRRLNPKSDAPDGKRIWSWLVLCSDKTVILITEDSTELFNQGVDVSASRRNMLNVFSQLSRVSDPSRRNPISLVPIRHAEGSLAASPTVMAPDAPGLLFYYLFDDWYSSYSLVAKQDRYGDRLAQLRERMLNKAELENINELHQIGRQLACLQRLYKSYELIISRLLSKHCSPSATAEGALYSHPVSRTPTGASESENQALESYDQLGVYLTSAARVRFERLQDRIELYALSEIDECIALKDSLVSMNFNLISMRESTYVERLTRITILLSKATLLFLPVSLLTAYGSLPASNVSIEAYWIAFAVLMFVSFSLIVLFGIVSQTLEGSMIYQTVWQRIWDAVVGVRQTAREIVGRGEDGDKERIE